MAPPWVNCNKPASNALKGQHYNFALTPFKDLAIYNQLPCLLRRGFHSSDEKMALAKIYLYSEKSIIELV